MSTTTTIETKQEAKQDVTPLRTKHLAQRFKVKATHLRRVLRSMKQYADGVHTNYRWAENDKNIPLIEAEIKKQAKDKQERAAKAKAELDAKKAKELAEAKAK